MFGSTQGPGGANQKGRKGRRIHASDQWRVYWGSDRTRSGGGSKTQGWETTSKKPLTTATWGEKKGKLPDCPEIETPGKSGSLREKKGGK